MKRKIIIWVGVVLGVLVLVVLAFLGGYYFVSKKLASERAKSKSALRHANEEANKYRKTVKELEAKLKEKPEVVTVPAEVEKVPDDIPLHPDFEWTPPLDIAVLFPKEDFKRVVFSSHKNLGESFPNWDWYKSKLEEKGWSNILYVGGPRTNLHARKGDRHLYIQWEVLEYWAEEGRPAGRLNPAGGQYALYYR